MEPVSRRLFFKQAGTAAAAAGAVAFSPLGITSAHATTIAEPPLTPTEDLAPDEHLVAHVTDARTGEIRLFIGERDHILHDRKIAARLVRAARRARR